MSVASSKALLLPMASKARSSLASKARPAPTTSKARPPTAGKARPLSASRLDRILRRAGLNRTWRARLAMFTTPPLFSTRPPSRCTHSP
eukprot:4700716-Pleurochrysis_carterae.AAC.1